MGFLASVRRILVGDRHTDLWMWVVPAASAAICAAMVWLVMMAVPWFVKVPVAAIAFLYVGAQSAMYLARDEQTAADEGPGQEQGPEPTPEPPVITVRIGATADEPARERELEASTPGPR